MLSWGQRKKWGKQRYATPNDDRNKIPKEFIEIIKLVKDFSIERTTNADSMAFKLSYMNSFKYNCQNEILEFLIMLWTESDVSQWFADSNEWNFTDSKGDYYVIFKILKDLNLG